MYDNASCLPRHVKVREMRSEKRRPTALAQSACKGGVPPPLRARNRSLACKIVQMAERVGFEPTVRFPAHTLSKRAP